MNRDHLANAHQTIRDLRNQIAAQRAPLEQRIAELEARAAELQGQIARLNEDLAAHQQALAGLVGISFRRLASGKMERR
jgi:uncharacterized coiled-coil protein SlyX